jgi:UDP-N-acetyl-D-galactosamine dehydrogenase
MGSYVAQETVKLMVKAGRPVKGSRALMLGITFKENCPDIRNTRAIDIYHELQDYTIDVDIYDPWADKDEVKHEYGLDIVNELPIDQEYGSVILAVSHNEFKEIDFSVFKDKGAIIFDVKSILSKDIIDARL